MPSKLNDKLRQKIADILYSVEIGNKQGYIYLLIEHQSSPEKQMAVRLLKYQIAIMEHHLKKNKELPIVYPLVLYSGEKPYNKSTNLFDLFGKQKELAQKTMFTPYQLIDLSKLTDKELKPYLWFGVLAQIMKHIRDEDLVITFKGIMEKLKIIVKNGDLDYIYSIVTYLFEASEIENEQAIIETIKELEIKEENIVTLAQRIEQRGLEKGIEQGKETIALELLRENIPLKKVMKITKISESRLKELLSA